MIMKALSQSQVQREEFFKIYEDFKYLPITTDSHLGEYVQWAYMLQIKKLYYIFMIIIKRNV